MDRLLANKKWLYRKRLRRAYALGLPVALLCGFGYSAYLGWLSMSFSPVLFVVFGLLYGAFFVPISGVVIGLPIVLWCRWARIPADREPDGWCAACGYRRVGLPADAPCPECGRKPAAGQQ